LNKNVRTEKIANILETAGNIAKSSNSQPLTLLLGVLQRMIIVFKSYRLFFCSKLIGIFKVVKMNFGSKFGAWVTFHTAILQS